uniref:Uncharacterized protein n=1 Tax=Arundo donax TaxID=35708 RepID=A0A0A9GDZ4_ARUDO
MYEKLHGKCANKNKLLIARDFTYSKNFAFKKAHAFI